MEYRFRGTASSVEAAGARARAPHPELVQFPMFGMALAGAARGAVDGTLSLIIIKKLCFFVFWVDS
jgi:hypothetical protein